MRRGPPVWQARLCEFAPQEHGAGSESLTPGEARFVREARITAQLDHPGIAPVHEVGRRADGSLYATQKLVRGRTLAAALASCRTLQDRGPAGAAGDRSAPERPALTGRGCGHGL